MRSPHRGARARMRPVGPVTATASDPGPQTLEGPSMLPGFGGYLISEFFLESHLRSHHADANTISTTQARSRLEQWRRHCRSLGPSSSVRALLETGAVPLVEALGFEAPRRVQQIDSRVVVATIGSEPQSVVLVVGPWCERLDPLWRIGVTHAIRQGALWCLLF